MPLPSFGTATRHASDGRAAAGLVPAAVTLQQAGPAVRRRTAAFCCVVVGLACVMARLPTVAAVGCEPLPSGSLCAGVLNYTSAYTPAAYGCTSATEANFVAPFGNTLAVLSSACRNAAASLLCLKVYPACAQPTLAPCQSRCSAVVGACSAQEMALLGTAGLNVTTSCSAGDASGTDCNGDVASPVTTIYPRCEPAYTGTVCRGIIDPSRPVYVPAGASQAALEASVASKAWVLRLAPKANGCREVFGEFLCTGTFWGCDTTVLQRAVGQPVPMPFPRLPCGTLCDTLYSACPATFLSAIGLAPNCSAVTPTTCAGQSSPPPVGYKSFVTFPRPTSVWGLVSGRPLTTTCQGVPDQAVANPNVSISVTCPYPLVVPDALDAPTLGGGSCAMKCPSPIFTDAEWDALAVVAWTLLVGSVAGAGFCAVTWVAFKRTQECLTCLLCSCFVYSSFYLAAASNPDLGHSACRDNSQVYVQGQSEAVACVFMAVWMYYFGMASVFWWFCLMCDAFDQVVINPKEARKRWPFKRKLFHAWAWGVPALYQIAILGGKAYSSDVGATCQPSGDYSKAYWYTLLSVVVIGVVMLGWICVKLYRDAAQTKQLARYWAHNKRLLAFLFAWFWMLIIMSMCRLYFNLNTHTFDRSVSDWVLCLMQFESTTTCGAHPDPRFNISIFFLNSIVTSALGLIIFVVYGTMENNCLYWRDVCCGKPDTPDGQAAGELVDRYREHSVSVTGTSSKRSTNNGQSTGGSVASPGVSVHSPANSMAAAAGGGGGAAGASSGGSRTHLNVSGAAGSRTYGGGVNSQNPHSREPAKLNLSQAMPHLSLTSEERGSKSGAAQLGLDPLARLDMPHDDAAAAAAAVGPDGAMELAVVPDGRAAATSDAAPPPPPPPADGSAAGGGGGDDGGPALADGAGGAAGDGYNTQSSAGGGARGRDESLSLDPNKLGYFFDK